MNKVKIKNKDRYWFISYIYEIGCKLASFNQIQRCRTDHFSSLIPGQSVLFLGVGEGQDALLASEKGLKVTVLDSSACMLLRFQKNCENKELKNKIDILHEDLFLYQFQVKFDVVVANFFLNVFSRTELEKVLEIIKNQIKPGGKFIVSDFALPSASFFLFQFLQKIYWYCVVFFFSLFAGNAFHRIENYEEIIKKHGFEVLQVSHFGIGSWKMFSSIILKDRRKRE